MKLARRMTLLITALVTFVSFFVTASACWYIWNQPKVPSTMLEE